MLATLLWVAQAWGQDPAVIQHLPALEELPTWEDAAIDPMLDASAGSFTKCCPPGLAWHLGGKGRGYYLNDHRVEFTGQEATFAVEGVVEAGCEQRQGDWLFRAESELFLNQPYDRNILVDDALRQSFASNFDIEPFQISQLYVTAERGDWSATIGRFVTPFGRFYYPLYRNSFDDSPFIRSEAIHYRETGMLLEWNPEGYALAAALTNGGFEQDTNSSKALVARAGIDREWFGCGASIKMQDGMGSENQKLYNGHAGLDAMVRRGNWTLSGEVIYDQYGLRRPDLNPLDIFWGRSLYYRDINKAPWEPINGVGYYLNLGYEGPLWSLTLNYGEFYPEQLGHRQHDTPTRRSLIKGSRHWTENFETYAVVLLENDLKEAFSQHTRYGTYVIFGAQFVL